MSEPSDCTEGCDHPDWFHKWEIKPNPYNKDFDTFVTDDDKEALLALNEAAEQAWDTSEPGGELKIVIRMNPPQSDAVVKHVQR